MDRDDFATHRDYWWKQAARVCRQVNLAWWLESLAAPLLVTSIAGAAGLLWVRREVPETAPGTLAGVAAAVVVLVAILMLLRTRKRFENTAQSLVRIEAAMRMRNALSAAEAGVAPWPAPSTPRAVHAGLGWNWTRLCLPLLGPLAIIATGLWIPISAATADSQPTEQPQAWGRLASELDQLATEELVEESYIEETRKQLEELQSQPEESWFSHASLEATDTLRKAHSAETGRVAGEMDKTADALQSMERNPKADAAQQQQMMQEFDQALEGLRNGAMKPNPELLSQLRELDLKNLTPEQLEQLREKLRENAEKLRQCDGNSGEGEGEGDEWKEGEGECEGEGENGVPGGGQPQRGPGHVPQLLGEAREKSDTGAAAPLEAQDLSHSSTGDLLELQDGEHDVDRGKSSLSSGGDTRATGSGGDRVWRDSLDPAEQRAIKRFFE
jgi:hypothetical protein